MEFKIYTLVDITESGVHRGNDRTAVRQQANYNSVIQTIGIRANCNPIGVKHFEESINKLKFGSDYKNKQRYWELTFSIDYGASSVEMLEEDFNLIPILTGLTESVKIEPAIFITKDSNKCNIFFEQVDK